MSVMQELALTGAMGTDAALLAHPLALTLTLLSAALMLYALILRQQRLRGATAAACQTPKTSARASHLPAETLANLRPSQGLRLARAAEPPLASEDREEPPAEKEAVPRRERGSRLPDPPVLRPIGLPQDGPGRMGLTQTTLRTTQRCRSFGVALFALSLALAFGAPLLLPAGAEASLSFRLFTSGLVLLALWHLLWTLLWRLDYDSIGLSSRNRWLTPEARMWRSLTGISSDGPFITLFHFADGLVMRVPNAIRGRAEMMQTARSWLRHTDGESRP